MSGYDAVIIGGGPAGCSAAITLAQQGRSVALLEAKHYPHHKVCGEFLSPECGILLEQLGLTQAICDHQPVLIEHTRITAPDGTCWDARLPHAALGLTRYALDAAMAAQVRALDVHVSEVTTATGIEGNLADGFVVSTRTASGDGAMQARVVIAAHGKRSGLDRALNRRFLNTPQPYTALKAHFRGAPIPNRIELHTFRGGYCGMSEAEDGTTNVCLLAQKAALQEAGSIEAFIAWMQTQNPHLLHWLSDAEMLADRWLSISEVPFIAKRAVVDDVLMVGDAAGLIAPLAGDGIAMALHSGQVAAGLAHLYLASEISASQLCDSYQRTWRRIFQARLRLSWLLQPLMFSPRAASTALRLIKRMPSLGDLLIAKTRDMGLIRS